MAASFHACSAAEQSGYDVTERALLDGLQPVAVHVAEVQLAVRGPGNLLVRLERDDLGGDAVQPGG